MCFRGGFALFTKKKPSVSERLCLYDRNSGYFSDLIRSSFIIW